MRRWYLVVGALLAGCGGGGTFASGPGFYAMPEVPLSALSEGPTYHGQRVRTTGVYQGPHLITNCPAGSNGIIFLDPALVDPTAPPGLGDYGRLVACVDENQLAYLVQFPPSMTRFRLEGEVAYTEDDIANLGFPAILTSPSVDFLGPIGISLPFF